MITFLLTEHHGTQIYTILCYGDGDSSNGRPGVPGTRSSFESCTEEQITIVRDIRRKKDYYNILGLEKTSSVEELEKLTGKSF